MQKIISLSAKFINDNKSLSKPDAIKRVDEEIKTVIDGDHKLSVIVEVDETQ